VVIDDIKDEWIILDSLVGIILHYRLGCVVEIGVGEGFSTRVLFKHVKDAGVKFYTCDINSEIEFDYKDHFHFLGASFDFMKQFTDIPSVVFLDGCHHDEIVFKEVEFFLTRLVPGGVIFLHDTAAAEAKNLGPKGASTSYKVRQCYETLTDEVDCFTWPYTARNHGLTMILKKEKDRPYWRK